METTNSVSLREFLETYTIISKKFISEYFVFYDLCQDEQFGIKIEDVIKYLEIEKRDKFYERFKSNYKEGVDYMTYSTGLSKRSGNSNIMYKCTFNCFQKICMMSKSKKANSVRDYFITLHEFIDYYKNEISETINLYFRNRQKTIFVQTRYD
jgi:phage anti-repressor protein